MAIAVLVQQTIPFPITLLVAILLSFSDFLKGLSHLIILWEKDPQLPGFKVPLVCSLLPSFFAAAPAPGAPTVPTRQPWPWDHQLMPRTSSPRTIHSIHPGNSFLGYFYVVSALGSITTFEDIVLVLHISVSIFTF